MPSTTTGRRHQPAATAATRRLISSGDGATSTTVRFLATWLVTVCIRSLPNGTPVRSRNSDWAVSYPTFKGEWYASANFATWWVPGTRHGRSPPQYRPCDDTLVSHGP